MNKLLLYPTDHSGYGIVTLMNQLEKVGIKVLNKDKVNSPDLPYPTFLEIPMDTNLKELSNKLELPIIVDYADDMQGNNLATVWNTDDDMLLDIIDNTDKYRERYKKLLGEI